MDKRYNDLLNFYPDVQSGYDTAKRQNWKTNYTIKELYELIEESIKTETWGNAGYYLGRIEQEHGRLELNK